MILETWMMDDTVDGLEILPQHATTMWLEVSPLFVIGSFISLHPKLVIAGFLNHEEYYEF